jgi:Zn-dependent protease with chaperone function
MNITSDSTNRSSSHPGARLDVNPVSAPMYIVNPLAGANASNLFSIHPPVHERIRRPRAYDEPAQRDLSVAAPPRVRRRAA